MTAYPPPRAEGGEREGRGGEGRGGVGKNGMGRNDTHNTQAKQAKKPVRLWVGVSFVEAGVWATGE